MTALCLKTVVIALAVAPPAFAPCLARCVPAFSRFKRPRRATPLRLAVTRDEGTADETGNTGRTTTGGIVWSGSSYSSKPDEGALRRRLQSRSGVRTVELSGCGSVRMRQRPDWLDPGSGGSGSSRGSGTGVALWTASLAVADYVDSTFFPSLGDGRTCLELGAGLGLPSIVAARCGMSVVATESDPEALSLLEENLRSNLGGPAAGGGDGDWKAHSLDWSNVAGDPDAERNHPAFVALERLGGADLVLLSDLVFGATRPAWGALLSLLNRIREQRRGLVLEAGGGCTAGRGITRADGTRAPDTDPLVILGYTQRRRDMSAEDEGRFFAMVRAAGMEACPIPFDQVPKGEERLLTTLFELRWM